MKKQKLKILVVDDNKQMVKTICDILELEDYETETTFNGEAAVEKVKNAGIDCVLMDIKMSGTDGLTSMVKMKGLYPDLPVMLMSAAVTEDVINTAKKLGAFEVLDKPFKIDVLLSFLAKIKKGG